MPTANRPVTATMNRKSASTWPAVEEARSGKSGNRSSLAGSDRFPWRRRELRDEAGEGERR